MSLNSNEAKGFYKLSWLQRIGFGAGDSPVSTLKP